MFDLFISWNLSECWCDKRDKHDVYMSHETKSSDRNNYDQKHKLSYNNLSINLTLLCVRIDINVAYVFNYWIANRNSTKQLIQTLITINDARNINYLNFDTLFSNYCTITISIQQYNIRLTVYRLCCNLSIQWFPVGCSTS